MKLSTVVASLFAIVTSSHSIYADAPSSMHKASEIPWFTNFEQAKAAAKAENKPLFLYFTGSDWCPWCKKMDKEILSTGEFQQAMDNKVIFVKVDFPRTIKLDEATKKQNDKLAATYGVRGFPTVVLLDSDLNTIKSLNYQPGGGAQFAARVLDTIDEYKQQQAKQ